MTVLFLIVALALILLVIIWLMKLSVRNNGKMEKHFKDISFKLENDMHESIERLKQEINVETSKLLDKENE